MTKKQVRINEGPGELRDNERYEEYSEILRDNGVGRNTWRTGDRPLKRLTGEQNTDRAK